MAHVKNTYCRYDPRLLPLAGGVPVDPAVSFTRVDAASS